MLPLDLSVENVVRTPEEVLHFWFGQLTPQQSFEKNKAVDDAIRANFTATHLSLARLELNPWRLSAASRLAALLVLDQFSRNIYRGTALAFATDWVCRWSFS
jgi:uncharacterized protein (DUF924 family)